MNRPLTINVIVEGQTENRFCKEVLAPYWAARNIFVNAPIIRTREDKKTGTVYTGGDIRFERIKNQVGKLLQQRQDVLVASFVDYYGIKEWPGREQILPSDTPEQIANRLNSEAYRVVSEEYADFQASERYVPFTAVHEFETLRRGSNCA